MHAAITSFTVFDYVIIALLVFGCLFGLARGFFRELLILVIWLLAYAASAFFADPFSSYVSDYIDDALIAYLLTFVLIFFVVWLAGSFINLLMSIFSKSVGASALSRIVGGVLGIGQGILMSLLVMFLMSNIPNLNDKWFAKSVSVNVAQPALTWMKTNLISQK